MHHNAVANAAISHSKDDDADLRYHCNVFASLSTVSGLPSLKELIFKATSFRVCFQI